MSYDYEQKAMQIKLLKNEIANVYNERDRLVALLTKFYPSYLAKHETSDTSWDEEWTNIVYIETPEGQLSWHIHESELPLFQHLSFKQNNWDGHTTKEKYRRIEKLVNKQ